MVPAGQRDGQSAITFADPPSGKHHKRAATPRGDHCSALMRPDQKGKGGTRKGNAPASSWPKGEGPKGTRMQTRVTRVTNSRVTRVTSTRARAAYTAVADPPGQGRRQAAYKGAQAAPFPYPSPMYPTFPMGGFMQQPMAGMMPQMWPGAMPQSGGKGK